MKCEEVDFRRSGEWKAFIQGRMDGPHGLVRVMYRWYDGHWEFHVDNEKVEFWFHTTEDPDLMEKTWDALADCHRREYESFSKGVK